MRQPSLILIAGFVAGCSDPSSAPTDEGLVALKQEPAPTIATNIGPDERSGCSNSLSGFWAAAAYDVNADGVAVGLTDCVAGETLTFRWSESQGMEQLANFLPDGYPLVGVGSINESGTIATIFHSAFLDSRTVSRPVLWTLANERIELVAEIECDEPTPPCNTGWSYPHINDKDVVVGTFIDGAYRWTAETGLVYLPVLGAREPTGINSHGDIIAAGATAALLRKSGHIVEISGFRPNAINNKRQIAGYSGAFPNPAAVIWNQGQGLEPLGTLGGTFSIAYDINDKGEVVGASRNAAGEMRAFYWTKARGMVDLGPGIAYAISEAGHIVGTAPSGLFPPDLAGGELWQAFLWVGTAGVQSAALASRESGMRTSAASECFDEELNWQSKLRMLRCLAHR